MLAWFLHFILSTIFSIYIRGRKLYHAVLDRVSAILNHHHRTPESKHAIVLTYIVANLANTTTVIRRDVKPLDKLPKHLSVVLQLPPEHSDVSLLLNKLDILVHDACEIVAWSAAAGIPTLSIYERSGLLKSSLTHLHRRIERTLTSYYGATSPSKPTFSLRAPNIPSYSPPHSPEPTDQAGRKRVHINILLLDASDGRQTLVDLTKTLAEMSQNNKLHPSDISTDLIDAEISESVMGEPDLLILFGDKVVLDGYPPWQVRLTEIFHLRDHLGGVGYNVFLRALYKYGKAEMRFGR